MKKLSTEQAEVIAKGFDEGFSETEKEAAAEGYSNESIITIYTILQEKIKKRIEDLQKTN